MILGVMCAALLVREYEEAKLFYRDKLGFKLVEDTSLADGKRWIRVKAPGGLGTELLLSRAVNSQELASVGNQAGGRVLFFLHTDAFDVDYQRLVDSGVEFVEVPRNEVYGKVAVLKDLYGNRIDLIQPQSS
jgi:catechol 2,3-dioxygenase-like lactoylglutathione lyase family enzyme